MPQDSESNLDATSFATKAGAAVSYSRGAPACRIYQYAVKFVDSDDLLIVHEKMDGLSSHTSCESSGETHYWVTVYAQITRTTSAMTFDADGKPTVADPETQNETITDFPTTRHLCPNKTSQCYNHIQSGIRAREAVLLQAIPDAVAKDRDKFLAALSAAKGEIVKPIVPTESACS